MRLLPILLFLSVPTLTPVPTTADADAPTDPLAEAVRLFHGQQLEAAESLLLDARETQPENPEVAYYLGRVYLAQERSKEAVEALERSCQLAPDSSLHQFWLAEALVQRIDEVAVLFKLGIANRIRAAYEKAVELDPESLEARIAVARYHAEAPPIAGGNPALTQEHLEEIRRRDPALAHVTQAMIHERLGRIEAAAEELATAVRVDPESVVSWRETALFYQRRQEWENSQRAFDQVLSRQPDDPVALYATARAAIEISKRQLARAERTLQAYLELEPNPAPKVYGAAEAPQRRVAYQRLGRVYERLGRPDLAALALESASGSVPISSDKRIDFPLVDAALVD